MTDTKTESRKVDIDSITIRSWPKVIFLYPVMITAFVCGFYQYFTSNEGAPNMSEWCGRIFYIVFCLNLLVIAFEFSRFKTLAMFFAILAVIFFLLYLSTRFEVFSFLRDMFGRFHVQASSSFYIGMGIYLFVVLGLVYINTRFNYWVIRSNEILHKEGFLGDVRRFPSPNLKMTKEIPDVFEFLILGAGRIVLNPAGEKQAIVLDHVLGVNAAERAIQQLLSALSVEIEGSHESESGEDHESIGTGH